MEKIFGYIFIDIKRGSKICTADTYDVGIRSKADQNHF